MRFCSHLAWLCMRVRFVCMFDWFRVFSLCYWCSFWFFNRKMSVDIFWHVLFWHSTVCWHIRLACFVVHFIACIFASWYCMRFPLLALFFAIVLSISFWFFVAKILTIVFFCFFAGESRCHFLDLRGFLVFLFHVFLRWGLLLHLTLQICPLVWLFAIIFVFYWAHFVCGDFLIIMAFVDIFVCPCFVVSFCLPVFFLSFPLL